MSEECAARAALRKIMESHKFNVAAMRPTDVHALCWNVLNPDDGAASATAPNRTHTQDCTPSVCTNNQLERSSS